MNPRVLNIASNTFREAVRDRVLYNLIAFALLMSGAAILIGQISIEIERLVVINLGLTAVSLFGIVIAIFIGIGLVSKEIERRTLYTILSRPVRRWEFIAGKFLGLGGDADRKYRLYGCGSIRRVVLCLSQISAVGCMDPGGALLHYSAIRHCHRAGSAIFVLFFAAAFRGIRVLLICDWQLRRRFAWFRGHGTWISRLARYCCRVCQYRTSLP